MNAKFKWSGKHVLWTLKEGFIKSIPVIAILLINEINNANHTGKVSERSYNLGYEDALEAQQKESEETEVTDA